ncbi:iron ABC transporter permease [Mesorhizobium sp.]|uniref:FecCD family ABC transporter permease n=1 Tax=Mesorhizobium sp. TaxID=1871066 RepID=UPI000FEA18FE|nr:iron ABC transporter permease [Mesorhizobium sp.]RWC27791.1 MAG: iron ABC transporter permease [Mesorhizobium sp.]TIX26978.1 MAG: iron ABC transporter permease [Mesorhizobium sp.]
MTAVIAVISLLVIAGGLMIGTRPLAPHAVLSALFAPDGKIDSILVWSLRLPRSLAAFVGGAGLGVSGYLLQTLTGNPLAGPGLTGVSAGAVAPIVFCFVFLPWLPSTLYPFIGMVGGLAGASITFWIARGGRGRPLHLALGGTSVSLFLGAITTYVLLLSGPQVPSLLFWLSGGFQGRSWPHLAYMAPWVIAGIAGALACHRVLGLLALSEQAAAGMGLRLAFWKSAVLFLSVLPVAGVAPIAGPVAFVGLATPHIVRLLRPRSPAWSVALTAVLGGLMTASADIIARSIAAPKEIPVGIITALIGGPVFVYLVQRRTVSLVGAA